MTDDIKNLIFVNGPINAFRMERNIGGINKVIYLFGDYHVNVTYQTECENMEAIEMKDYLLKNFRNSEKNNIDFFMEAEPNNRSIKMNIYREKYFRSIMKFFLKNFNVDTKKNKIYTSSSLPNVRFHYMDIRSIISFDFNFEKERLSSIVYELLNKYLEKHLSLSTDEIIIYIEIFKKIKENYIFIYNLLFKNKDKKEKYEYDEKIYLNDYKFNENIAKKIIKKIYYADDENIKNTLRKSIMECIKPKILKCVKITNKIIILFEEYKNLISETKNIHLNIYYRNKYGKITSKIYEKMEYLSEINSITNLMLTDMYFIRRFMDKKYITNAVIYAGNDHIMNYIYILIKYFDFKITNFSYLNIDTEKFTEIIKNTEINYDFQNLYKYIPFNNGYQCCDLTGFPNNFL